MNVPKIYLAETIYFALSKKGINKKEARKMVLVTSEPATTDIDVQLHVLDNSIQHLIEDSILEECWQELFLLKQQREVLRSESVDNANYILDFLVESIPSLNSEQIKYALSAIIDTTES